MATKLIILPFLSFFLSMLIIPGLRVYANKFGLIDKPNHRKVHIDPVPLIGGISLFISSILTVFLLLTYEDLKIYSSILFGAIILLFVGVVDDKIDLSASLKLIIQILLAHFIFTQGIKIESLHGFLGIYELSALMQYLLTLIIITGVVNAFNLMDGIDGLAGGLSIVSFFVFGILSYILGLHSLVFIFSALIGATLAFLYFNLNKKGKVFMGDAGSLMIGFVLAVTGIKLLQSADGHIQMQQVMLGVVFIFIIPVFDALRVFRKRMKEGKSPFNADRSHLHHLVLSTGMEHKKASTMIIILMIVIIALGYFFFNLVGLTLSFVMSICLFFLISYGLQLNDNINYWKKRIKGMEVLK